MTMKRPHQANLIQISLVSSLWNSLVLWPMKVRCNSEETLVYPIVLPDPTEQYHHSKAMQKLKASSNTRT